jgi:hypothetical protein
MVTVIRGLVAALDARLVAVLGNSIGACGALVAGADLEASRMLVFCARAPSTAAEPQPRSAEQRGHDLQAAVGPVHEALSAMARAPEVTAVYGDDNPEDVETVRLLERHPAVRSEALEGFNRHNGILQAILTRRLAPLLQWLVGYEEAQPPPYQ